MTTDTHTYSVPGMTCDHCKAAIEKEILPLDGVEGVQIDVDSKQVTVTGGDNTAIVAAIDTAGYAVA
jgi:copper chaperone